MALQIIDDAVQAYGAAGVSQDTPAGAKLGGNPHAAPRRRAGRSPQPRHRQAGVRQTCRGLLVLREPRLVVRAGSRPRSLAGRESDAARRQGRDRHRGGFGDRQGDGGPVRAGGRDGDRGGRIEGVDVVVGRAGTERGCRAAGRATSPSMAASTSSSPMPAFPAARLIFEQSSADWEEILRVNLIGPLLAIKHAAPVMKDRGGGSIICTASVAGIRAGAGGAGLFGVQGGRDQPGRGRRDAALRQPTSASTPSAPA